MHRDGPAFLRRLPTLRLVGASCVLVLYLLTATPLAPVLTTLLAVADRSHHVAVQQTARSIQVVLRHDCFNSPTHRHGIIARALILIAEPPAASQPDHVIQFATSATSEQASALALEPALDTPASELFPPCDLLPRPAPLTGVPAVHPCPPPSASSSLLGVRSIVLLI